MQEPWTCPYCNQIATITQTNVSESDHLFANNNKEDCTLAIRTNVVVCPNSRCREFTIGAALYRTKVRPAINGGGVREIEKPALLVWSLKPKSKAKPLPAYIPAPIQADYQEACLILSDSPKASATLSRRCLQGMIRDFWNVSKPTLFLEIQEIKNEVAADTWAAIDAVRSIGNIGAHMEKDINLIVDVDADEADVLIQLLETLFQDWYVTRQRRAEQMSEIIRIAQAKAALKGS